MVDTSIRMGRAAAAACSAILLGACTGGVHNNGSGSTTGSAQYTVGGTVSGLSGLGLVLVTNRGETLNVGGNGSFTFKTSFPSGSPYYVLVLMQPSTPTQTCLPANAAGTVDNANVTAITVVCKDKTAAVDAIGGMVVGLSGSGLVLRNNGGDALAVSSNGTFAFPTTLPSGSQYDVSVFSPPINPYEDCVVLNGQGTTADGDVANIAVACTVNVNPTHTISGTVSGVSGTLVLENNGRDALTLTADGPFKFSLPIPSGSTYSVTTKSAAGAQSQACTFTNASGLVGNSDISNVAVACKANVSLKASVSGLSGTGLVLQNTANGDSLAVAANGTSAFGTGIATGDPYTISVTAQPTNPTQTCVVANGAGTASAGSTVAVTCTTNTYTVSGVVTGLPDPSSGANLNLVLQNNSGDNITMSPTANSPVAFTFAMPVASGTGYSVTVLSQPGISTSFGTPGVVQTSTVCVASAGTGTVTNANITNVVVNCVRPLGFAYVINSGDNTISPYIIDSVTGALLPSGPPVSAGTLPSAAAANGNSLLYVSNSSSNNLSGYGIDPNTGSLTPLSGSPFAPGLNAPTSVASYDSVAGPGVYVTNSPSSGAGSISGFTIGNSGTSLTNIVASPFATQLGPTAGLFFHGGDTPTFNNYYLETDSTSNTVSAYLVNSNTGALSAAANSPFATGPGPRSVVGIQTFVPATGTNADNVYVANSGDGTISIYTMNTQTGTLTPLQAGPVVSVGAGLSALAAAPCGCYLLASASQGVSVFSTNATGVLAPVAGSPFAAGSGPGPIATLSNYVYVINTVDQTISVFTQNSATGALTPIAGAAVKTGRTPSSIVVITRPAFG
jgi:6-phosphogluconolactonase (cycloisomerase 2 family)